MQAATVLMLVVVLAIGIAIGYLGARTGSHDRQRKSEAELAAVKADLHAERALAAQSAAFADKVERQLGDRFKALSADTLDRTSRQFFELAGASFAQEREVTKQGLDKLITPIKESLHRFDDRMQAVERDREQAYGALRESVRAMYEGQKHLATETHNLTTALRSPAIRGRWGELHLRRVVELAGMIEYCDFREQSTVLGEDGVLRPDLVVRMPGGGSVVVDAKTPLQAYLDASEANDEGVRASHLADHAKHVRSHIHKLSQKSYWQQFAEQSPDFVMLFLPGDGFFAAALQADPSLIEVGVESRVIIATPTTLIALLRTIAYSWRQERISENAQAVSQLGRELYQRVGTFAEHFAKVGTHLERAVGAYNQSIGSLETRVLATARKFPALGASTDEGLLVAEPIELLTRSFRSAELTGEEQAEGG